MRTRIKNPSLWPRAGVFLRSLGAIAVRKRGKGKECERYTQHCLNLVEIATDSEISGHSTRKGGRIAKPRRIRHQPKRI